MSAIRVGEATGLSHPPAGACPVGGQATPLCGTIMIFQREDSTFVQHSSCSEKFSLHKGWSNLFS